MTVDAFAGLEPCVHCGFCLQACPTFLVTGDEADSPRGRIVLMQSLRRGRLPAADPALALHLDRCLGCRACEPVCPAGVSYAPALEAVREILAGSRPIPFAARLVHAVMAEPAVRRPLLRVARLLRPLARRLAGGSAVGIALGMLGVTGPSALRRENGRTGGQQRGRESPAVLPSSRPAVIFRGCIMEGLFPHVHAATARVLRANGYALEEVPDQGCCGALHAHAGQRAEAVALARRNVRAFASAPQATVVVNSAGCGALLKEYGRLVADDRSVEFAGRVCDVSEALAARGPRPGAPLALRVAYDPPCHLLHAQRVAQPVEAVLDAIPEITRVPHDEAEACCGSAGSYSLTQPELSRAVVQRKVEALLAAEPDVVATGNPGCIMQIGAGLLGAGRPIPVVHPVELLDWSYRKAGYYDGRQRDH